MDFYTGLVVRGSREDLALALGNGGVTLDELGHHATEGLDAQRQRRHVQEQHVLHITGQDAALYRRTDRHHFIRVHTLVWLFVKQPFHHLLHQRHAG